jgi:Ca2+-binding RTX toxin-like protein
MNMATDSKLYNRAVVNDAQVTVTSLADSGAGSLREAIALATPGSTIGFAENLAGQTITLTGGQLLIDKNLTLDGSNAPGITISGNNASRVIETARETHLILKHLTIADGRVTGSDAETGAGGGILTGSDSSLTVEQCKFLNNVAGFGGGIYNGFRSQLTVLDSQFEGNDGSLANAERGGGAIATKSAGLLTIRGSRFVNNRGTNGGAINNLLSTLLVENSTFLNNDTTSGAHKADLGGFGGAIYTDGANASGANFGPGATGSTITIRGSWFEGNQGAGQGGALFLFVYPPDQVIVENSLIANNSVIPNASGSALGGGLRHGNGELVVRNTTFANNLAVSQGGGLWIGEESPVSLTNVTLSGNRADDGQGGGLGGAITFANGANPSTLNHVTVAYNQAGFMGGAFWGGGASVTLSNSIVAFNAGGNPWGLKQQSGEALTDGGNNIEFPLPTASDDVRVVAGGLAVDPGLGPLQTNGGFAPTHALLTGSAAVNAGNSAIPVVTDGRGVSRAGQPDIGAFEAVRKPTFQGTGGNDFLVGTRGRDSLVGNSGDDYLAGNAGPDQLTGGDGADYFVYAGNSPRETAVNSRGKKHDRIIDFKPGEGDRIFYDLDNNGITDPPKGLFNAGQIFGTTPKQVLLGAIADKDQRQRGSQPLRGDEALFFAWKRSTYLLINDSNARFSLGRDLLVDVSRMEFPGRDAQVGTLAVADYFA